MFLHRAILERKDVNLYNDWMYLLYNIVVPCVLMAFFGVMTIVNVRRRIIRPMLTAAVVTCNRQAVRRIDRHLRRLILLQVSQYFTSNLSLRI